MRTHLVCAQTVAGIALAVYGVAWPVLMVVLVLLHRCTELPEVRYGFCDTHVLALPHRLHSPTYSYADNKERS